MPRFPANLSSGSETFYADYILPKSTWQGLSEKRRIVLGWEKAPEVALPWARVYNEN
jgi:hypothetical protein